jgi:hypothetical protein
VGTLGVSYGTGSYTFALTTNPGGRYAISGNQLVTAATLVAGTDTIAVRADNGAGSVVNSTFSIIVTHPAVVPPSAPVLILVSATSTATFTIDVDNTIAAGDSVELQVQVTGGSWSPLVSDTVHTITAGEDAANQINLSLGLPNGSYDARALVTDTVGTGLSSSWSNTVVNFTISGAVSTQIYFLAIEGF